MTRVVRPLPLALLGLTVLVSVASVPISLGREPLDDTLLYPVNAIAFGIAGALVTTRQPRHPIGWVLTIVGALAGLEELVEGYGYHAGWPGAPAVAWTALWVARLGIGGTAIVLALFPSGRDLGRFRLALVVVGTAATVLMAIGAADPSLPAVAVSGDVLFVVVLLAAIGSVLLRFRRATGVERQQLKWVAYVVGLLAVAGPLAIFFYDQAVVQVAIVVVITCLPTAICVAILRYRLYDIDVIVNRTLVYGSLTVLLAAAYVAVALILGVVAGDRRSAWVTAGATLAVAAAFRPVRSRLQDAVDRRFRRARYDALARADAFLDDLRAGRAEPEALESLLRDVTGRPGLTLRYLPPGSPAPELRPGERLIARAGVPLAVLAGGGSSLPVEMVDRAVLAVEIARLRAEVRRRLAEVEESRARIVAAGYSERRRIERDLHDGAQQRLVSVGLALRHAQFQLGDSPVGRSLDTVVGQVAEAITELRELAHGIRPAGLDDGLEAALRELAGRTPMPVSVTAAAGRFPPDVEATAYFVACEALTNAVKHAAAREVHVRVVPRNGHLVLTVRDDGVGGARPAGGSGLRGLSDRVAAQGGRLHVDSPAGAGTTVEAELPCG